MGVRWKPPECQLRVVEGLPGAGKSFFLVRKTDEIIRKQKRPVYTNLPIRFRVFRQWLRNRAGEQYANLIVELTELHWFNFLKRNKAKQEFQDQYKSECKINGTRFFRSAFEAAWIEKAGPDITRPGEGIEPNWIPPLAVIIIDEVQHWHPMEKNIKGQDAVGLKAYLTMMRHHLHDVWVATQVWGNVSKAMRDMARQFMSVKSLSERKLLFGIRYRHLGLRGIGYTLHSVEQLQAIKSKGKGEDDFGTKPIESDLVFPSLRRHQVWFRLYDSFTHVASPRKMLEQLKRVQSEAGIIDLEEQMAAAHKAEKVEASVKFMRWAFSGFVKVLLVIIGAVVGAAVVGSGGGKKPETQPPAAGVAAVDSMSPEFVPWWPEEGRITGIGASGIMTTSGDMSKGGRFGRGQLYAVDAVTRRTIWVVGDDLWLWKLGSPQPERIASTDQLKQLNKLRGAPVPVSHGATVDPARPNGGGDVGTPEGDADRGRHAAEGRGARPGESGGDLGSSPDE